MEPYRTLYPEAGEALPQTERVSECVLALPTGTTIGHQEIELVATVIRSAYDCAAAIKTALN
jgi:dTDP-4-amino-4,6-dideoxygalactose transaminase